MSNTILKNALLTSTAFVAGSMMFASQAWAQAQPQEDVTPEPGVAPKENSAEVEEAQAEAATDATPDQDIVVTGTRISNPNLVQSSPVTVIGEGEIQLQQVASAEELLHEIPGHVPSLNQNVNNGGTGAAFINLRGLGSQRNLVLLDGQRLVPVDLSSRTDLNQIPPALIERVDVFTGGASTVYGADAVAGVINFITKRNFAGIDVDLGAGIAEEGDGAVLRGNVTVGANFDDGRGNAVLSIGIAETKPVFYGDRPFSFTAYSSATGGIQGSNTGVPVAINNTITACPAGPTGLTGGCQLDTATGVFGPRYNTYNTNPLNLLQTPLQRYNIFAKAHYEISDAVEAYTMGMYTRSHVLFNAAPTGIFNIAINVPVSNPYLTQAQRNFLCGQIDLNPSPAITQTVNDLGPGACATASTAAPGQPGYVELPLTLDRRFAEAGPRVTEYNFDTFQGSVGLRGPLTSTLDWDIVGAYGESKRIQSAVNGTRTGVQNAARAINTTQCLTAANAVIAGCVPLNIFGPEGSITPAMLASLVNTTIYNFTDTKLTQGQATISGDVGFALPWATQPIGVAAGVEFRKYWGFIRGDAIAASTGEVLGGGAAFVPVIGDYNSREAFAEVIVPIIEDRPFFHSLTLETGARYAHYDIHGGDWTYKLGGSWEPIPDIKFRAMYSKAVRAPNLAELFQPPVVALSSLTTDPCQGNPGALTALCIATGVPPSAIGTIPAPSSGQIQTTQGGNPNLTPETAKTFTAGVVLQPRMVPGFALTLDYYNIDVEEAITSPTNADIIQNCYTTLGNPNLDPANPFCQLVIRNAQTGRIDGDATTTPGLQRRLTNSGFLQTRGFDLTANYRKDVGFGRLSFAFNGNYTMRSRFKALAFGPTATDLSPNRECIGFYSPSCQPVGPRWSWSLRTTLSWLDGMDTSLLWRHVGAAKIEPAICTTNPALPCGPALNTIFDDFERIPAYDWFDLSNRWQATDNMAFVFSVQNLFDKEPPFVGNTIGATAFNGGNTFPSNYDTIGRSYRVGVNLKF